MENSTTPLDSEPHTVSTLDSLYPALVECFTVILVGYVSKRAGWVNRDHMNGLSFFAGKLAFPALLFLNMATLNWNEVEWPFLGAIFISKAILFILVAAFTFVLKPTKNIGMAGLMAIFVSQSNDFALGYPILKALYEKTQPHFLKYIYLIAPISVVVLNPVGFTLLEFNAALSDNMQRSKLRIVFQVVRQLLTNPIVMMTALGIAANFICNHSLPLVITDVLSTFADAFGSCALFILGWNITGECKKGQSSYATVCGLLTVLKLLVFPMMTMTFTRALDCGASQNATTNYTMFGFLYGTFPMAPSVTLYAAQYDIGVELVAITLVVCTIASAPLMFVSGMMFGIQLFPTSVDRILLQLMFDIGMVTSVLLVAVLVVVIVFRRTSSLLQIMVLTISLFQIFVSIGTVISSSTHRHRNISTLTLWDYVEFAVTNCGILGVSAMTTVAAISMYSIESRCICRVSALKCPLLIYGIVSPIVLTGIVLATAYTHTRTISTSIMFGHRQMLGTAVILGVNLLVTVAMMLLRYRKLLLKHRDNLKLQNDEVNSASGAQSDGGEPENRDGESASQQYCGQLSQNETTIKSQCESYGTFSSSPPLSETITEDEHVLDESKTDEENQRLILGRTSKTLRQQIICNKCCSEELLMCSPNDKDSDDEMKSLNIQKGKLSVLLLATAVCQLMMIIYYTVQVLLPHLIQNKLYLELEFIYILLSSGQGLFTFLIFGLKPITGRLFKLLKRMKFNTYTAYAP